MNKAIRTVAIFIILTAVTHTYSLDLSGTYCDFMETLDDYIDNNAGLTSFRSLLIPSGGKAEGMGSAFTALADDTGFFEFNPAGSTFQKQTMLALNHNNWIADSSLETLSWTQRADYFGYGAQIRCFYVPFTEYNYFGDNVSKGYYSETVMSLNCSYLLFPGYYFPGIAVGINVKGAFRSVPDYAVSGDTVVAGSGSDQSGLAIMADVGLLTKFNFFKMYHSRDQNAGIGITLRNAGLPVKDEPLPTTAGAGVFWRPIRPLTISADIQKPLNLQDIALSEQWYGSIGLDAQFTNFFSFRCGFQVKGANPRISTGAEIILWGINFDINYTVDMTTMAMPFNRLSISAKLNLGDRGRAQKAAQVDQLYITGMEQYAAGNMQEAIDIWEQALSLNPHFDPAIEGIEAAMATEDLARRIEDMQSLE